jgi:hypothetical protein
MAKIAVMESTLYGSFDVAWNIGYEIGFKNDYRSSAKFCQADLLVAPSQRRHQQLATH